MKTEHLKVFSSAHFSTVKPVLTATQKEDQKLAFKTNNRSMQVKYCRQSFHLHSLSYRLSLRPLFCLYLSGRFNQVLLYFESDFQPQSL